MPEMTPERFSEIKDRWSKHPMAWTFSVIERDIPALIAAFESAWAEVERLKSDAVKEMLDQSRLTSMKYNEFEGGEARMASPLVSVLANWIDRDVEQGGARNFLEQEFGFIRNGEKRAYLMTIVIKPEGKSPATMLAEANKEIERLKALVMKWRNHR